MGKIVGNRKIEKEIRIEKIENKILFSARTAERFDAL